MGKKQIHTIISPRITLLFFALVAVPLSAAIQLPGFTADPASGEQVVTFRWNPEMRIHINAPSAADFDPDKPVALALYALPNGNTIEQTVGKVLKEGDDWHFDIQHIGAQTRFLRNKLTDYNLVTVYLETKQLSWPAWKSQYPDYAQIIKETVEYLKSYFRDYRPFVVLTGHSGGGRFIFSFLDAFETIPDYVQRICFLDSDYGYEDYYGAKMVQWLDADSSRFVSVIAYNDSVALYNGQPIVSPTGGTWYRSKMMQRYLANFYPFDTTEDDSFIRHSALNGRIKIILKKNPNREILHTVQVERNGFIHTMVTGTTLESIGYEYYGQRAYNELIQDEALPQPAVQIPLRSPTARTGSAFMHDVENMSFEDREQEIFRELEQGNIPWFMRQLKLLQGTFYDANQAPHTVRYEVFPDYLAIGSDEDYCRIPMGPFTAQRIADFYGCSMPTAKLVDHIYTQAEIKLEPVTYLPVGNQNELVPKFVEHNTAIQEQLLASGAAPGQLVGGIKKDVVLSNLITDPNRPGHVVIYGWHRLNGEPIQPLTNIHNGSYVDYSHGIRLLNTQLEIDGEAQSIRDILKDPVNYKIVSNESGLMAQPSYIADGTLPARPKSFGLKIEDTGKVRLVLQPDSDAERHRFFTSSDGLHFSSGQEFSGPDYLFEGLAADSLFYIKLQGVNSAGSSPESEVLAAQPKIANGPPVLLVYGFDRPSSGNTFNFIRQHIQAAAANNYVCASATNEAVQDGLFQLSDYAAVDYILGDESTVDESFSAAEQTVVSTYLKQGGRLFVSGAEIAWDLDYKGSSADKSFMHNYLKVGYAADAPGNESGMHYTAKGKTGALLQGIDPIHFDDGSHGTIHVKYADALTPLGGAGEIATYSGVSSYATAGVAFEGAFAGGSVAGKLVYLGFPLETVYPDSTRNLMMSRILDFLTSAPTAVQTAEARLPEAFELCPNYPNPFNPQTTIEYHLPRPARVTLSIFDLRGAIVQQWDLGMQTAGVYHTIWYGKDNAGRPVASGSYFYRLAANAFSATRKMTLLK